MKAMLVLCIFLFSQAACAEVKTATIDSYQIEYEILGAAQGASITALRLAAEPHLIQCS